ncbi:MAG: hypothetical protein EOL97_12195 [Spirochaetia bacterium]|nr:hypothetical protein [Spirochaetia bacterium]
MNTRSNATFLFYLTMLFLIFNTYVTIENINLFLDFQPNIFENVKRLDYERTGEGTINRRDVAKRKYTQEYFEKQQKFAYIFPLPFFFINKFEADRLPYQYKPINYNDRIDTWWYNYYFSLWNAAASLIFLILGFYVLRNIVIVNTIGIFKLIFLILYVHFAANMIIGIAFVLFGLFKGSKRKD